MGVSFVVDAEEIAEETRRVASESISEEDLRQGVEYILKSKLLISLKKLKGLIFP